MRLIKNEILTATNCGSDGNLSVIGCFEIIENAITEHMGEFKLDGFSLREKFNALWVFTKNKIKFFKKIKWNEKFNVCCYISNKSLAKIYFDIEVKNMQGELIFYARVEACALDFASMRILKLSSLGMDKIVAEQPNMEVDFVKFDYENLPLIEKVLVRSTNIDMSHHTNNLEYLRFIMNTYSVNELETKSIKELEVNYISQSFENDTLFILKSSNANQDLIVLEKDAKPIIKCKIDF